MTDPASDLVSVAAQVGLDLDELDALIRSAGYGAHDQLTASRSALLRAFVHYCRSRSPQPQGPWRPAELLALAEDFARDPSAPPTTADPAADPPQR